MIFTNEKIQEKKNLVLGLFNKLDVYEWKLNRLLELLASGKINVVIKSTYDSNNTITCTKDIDLDQFLNNYKDILANKITDIESSINKTINYDSQDIK